VDVESRVRLRLLAIGKDRSGLYAPAVEEYVRRLQRHVRCELVEVPEARRHAGTPQARGEEGAALLRHLGPRERVIALDERGKELTSLELARRLEAWLSGGRDVTLVLGGSDGLAPEVLERADEKVALSRMTLAHRLARLVLAEQLYRAMTIVRGEPYHK
jgi:23S rRNA (pseudouridine1915-N3)-methyltransferase